METDRRLVHPTALLIPIGLGVVGVIVEVVANGSLGAAVLVPRLAGKLMGLVGCLSMVGFLVALPVWYGTRRNLKASTAAFCVVTLLAGGVLLAAWTSNLLENFRRRSSAGRVEPPAASASRADADAYFDGGDADLEVSENSLDDASASDKRDDATMRAALRRILARQSELQEAYYAGVGYHTDAGAFDYAEVATVEELRRCREAIAELAAMLKQFRQYADNLTTNLDMEMKARGVSPEYRAKAVAEFAKGVAEVSGPAGRSREIDAELLDLNDRILALMEKHWGSWSLDDDGAVAFDEVSVPPEDRLAYQDALASMESLSKEYDLLQQKLLELQAQGR